MITELYKILFEVLFLHEYYLTDSDQRSVFDAGAIADPGAYLAKRLQQGLPSTLDGVQVSVPAATQAVLNRQQMRLIAGYSGFQVAVRVTAAASGDGSTVYTPVVPLDDATSLLVLLQEEGGVLSAISNGRMQRATDGIYFFSNAPVSGARAFPSLSGPIPAKATNYVYEQGELIKDGKTVKAFYSDGKNPQFLPVTGDGFVNENDRILVATSFVYRFLPTDAVTNANFSLQDPSGKVLKTITVKSSGPLVALSLDLSQDDQGNPLYLSNVENSNAIVYTLKVTGSGNFSRTLPLVFYGDAGELRSSWGMVQIQAGVAAGTLSLLDGNGKLRTRINADGTVQPPPSFQLRVKSPLRFRKYINASGLALSAPAGNLTSFLQQSGGELTTLTPVPLTYLPYFFSTNPTAKSPTWVYLPAPGPGSAIESSNNQFFSVIRVPESKLFPISQ